MKIAYWNMTEEDRKEVNELREKAIKATGSQKGLKDTINE